MTCPNLPRGRPIIVTGSTAGAASQYVVKVEVTYDVDMQPDFDDLRFTDLSGSTFLDHWRESYQPSTSAIFWVKIPTIPASPESITICAVYGDNLAVSASNGESTFLFFDDFESGTMSKWNTTAAAIVDDTGNQVLKLEGSGVTGVSRTDSWTNVLISTKVKYVDQGPNGYLRHAISARLSGSGNYQFASMYGSGSTHVIRYNPGYVDLTFCNHAVTTGIWYNYSISLDGADIRGWFNGTPSCVATDSTHTSGGIAVSLWGAGVVNYVDDVYVRPYMTPEPVASVP
jgi:hypothetical protein